MRFVFPSAQGTRITQENIRSCALRKAVEEANVKLIEGDDVPLPHGLTPHKLRHTFARSWSRSAVDPGSVMDQTRPCRSRIHAAASTATECAATTRGKSACGSSSGTYTALSARRAPTSIYRLSTGKISASDTSKKRQIAGDLARQPRTWIYRFLRNRFCLQKMAQESQESFGH